jgi:vacuole morphology and inheritance protein 14
MTSRTKILNEDCPLFLEGKCPKLFCDRIHNYSKLYQKQNNTFFKQNFSYLQKDFTLILPYQKKLFENQQLDIMFLCDCTGSMQTYINSVKSELKNIIDFILENNPYADIKISFVGYRDISDLKRFEIIDFTNDINSIKNFIGNIIAEGGADLPEDLTGGLSKVIEMNWREKSAKYAIIIADAPCHGIKYFKSLGISDYYPKGDPNGLVPEDFIEKIAKMDITLYALKIKYYTDEMYQIFNEVYIKNSKFNSPIIISELGKSLEQFGFLVAVSSNTTLNNLTINKLPLNDILYDLEKKNEKNEQQILIQELLTRVKNSQSTINYNLQLNDNVIKLDEKIDLNRTYDTFKNTNMNNIEKAICHSFIISKDRYLNINWKNPYISHYNVETECSIDTIPFNEGAERYAYYMYDNIVNLKYVAKKNKIFIKSQNNINSMQKELESITICHHISNEFNDRIVNFIPKDKTDILINFIHSYIYEIPSQNKFYYVENLIPGKYVKYNNNAGWISNSIADQTLIAQAFSHFSYQITEGYLIIVDLQGVGGYLTDPQIHCLNGNKFGNGNLGYVGIIKFFLTHHCNKYCKDLNLIHPMDSKFNIDIEKFDFFVDKYEEPLNKNDDIFKLCDLCRKPFMMKSGEAFELKKKCWDCFCNDCDSKRKKSFKNGNCEKCGKFFMSSEYFYKMKRMPFPKLCMKCRQEEISEKREKYYKEFFEKKNEEDNNNN